MRGIRCGTRIAAKDIKNVQVCQSLEIGVEESFIVVMPCVDVRRLAMRR